MRGLLDRRAWRLIVIGGLQIALGTIAVGSLALIVQPSEWRDAVILLMWPLVIIAGTFIAWRWLGRLERGEGWMTLTEVIESGRVLRQRLLESAESEPSETDKAAWRVRVDDWEMEAQRVVGEVAPERLDAFKADVLYANGARGIPDWASGPALTLDEVGERLILIRASL